MTQFHVNNDGELKKCSTTPDKCKFSNNGPHFDSEEAGQEFVESQQKDAGKNFTTLKKTSKEDKTKFSVEWPKDKTIASRLLNISKVDQGMIDRLNEGKKVSDVKLDKFLYNNSHLKHKQSSGPNDMSDFGKDLYSKIESERESRKTESTLPTVNSFNPENESMFSNSRARTVPSIAGQAMSREAKHGDWMRELKSEHQNALNKGYAESEEDKKVYEGMVANCEEKARKSDVRLAGMLKEVKWLSDNSDDFKKNMTGSQKSMMTKYSNDVDGIILPAKKIKKD